MKVLILDDEFPVIRKIRNIINDVFCDIIDLEIVHFISIEDMLIHAMWFHDIDIACLDINVMNEKYNGIFAAKRLKTFNYRTLIIFITIHDDYFEELVNAEPFRFIYKDDIRECLPVALMDAYRRLERTEYFSYRYKKRQHMESMDDIMYFWSGEHRYIFMKLNDGTVKKFIAHMDEVEDELKKLKYIFVRANKSYIVNPIYIEQEKEDFLFIDGQTIKKTRYYHMII